MERTCSLFKFSPLQLAQATTYINFVCLSEAERFQFEKKKIVTGLSSHVYLRGGGGMKRKEKSR